MSVARSTIRGPRFALRSTEKVRACIRCVYGNGEHAAWCEKRILSPEVARPHGDRSVATLEKETPCT